MRSGFNSSLCVAGSISVSDCLEKRILEISGEVVQAENSVYTNQPSVVSHRAQQEPM